MRTHSSVLVISDSHGGIAALTAALNWANNVNLDAALFLGDGYEDLALASARTGFALPWHAVRGNGDFLSSVPDYLAVEFSGHKVFLTHGQYYRVREGCKTLIAAAQHAGAEAALFGHTHIPYCEIVNGIFLLNPGSISRPRGGPDCTFAVLECPESDPLSANFFRLVNRGGKTTVEALNHHDQRRIIR